MAEGGGRGWFHRQRHEPEPEETIGTTHARAIRSVDSASPGDAESRDVAGVDGGRLRPWSHEVPQANPSSDASSADLWASGSASMADSGASPSGKVAPDVSSAVPWDASQVSRRETATAPVDDSIRMDSSQSHPIVAASSSAAAPSEDTSRASAAPRDHSTSSPAEPEAHAEWQRDARAHDALPSPEPWSGEVEPSVPQASARTSTPFVDGVGSPSPDSVGSPPTTPEWSANPDFTPPSPQQVPVTESASATAFDWDVATAAAFADEPEPAGLPHHATTTSPDRLLEELIREIVGGAATDSVIPTQPAQAHAPTQPTVTPVPTLDPSRESGVSSVRQDEIDDVGEPPRNPATSEWIEISYATVRTPGESAPWRALEHFDEESSPRLPLSAAGSPSTPTAALNA